MTRACRWCAVFGCLLAAAIGAAEPTPFVPPPGSEVLILDQYIHGSVDRNGSFPGTIVCLDRRRSFAPVTAEGCEGDSYVYALMLTNGVAIPLRAQTPDAEAALPRLLNQRAVVRGQHSIQDGMIMAGTIEAARPAVEMPPP